MARGADAAILITVAICTWNRARLLRETLGTLESLIVPPDLAWEIVVVNNNCTDETPNVLAEFEARLPLRVISEPVPGHSRARNAAVREAHGEYIVWTDDDVLLDRGWLAAYHTAFRKYPGAVVFGGPVEPWFPNEPPDWLARVMPKVEGPYALRDFGPDDLQLGDPVIPFGANMAFRTARLRDFPFDTRLGRVGHGMLGGDETVVIRAMLRAGDEGRWIGDARVRHYIPAERQTIGYLRRWYAGYGATLARLGPSSGLRLFGRPRWVWRELVVSELRYRARRVYAPSTVWIEDLKRAGMARGRFLAARASGDGSA